MGKKGNSSQGKFQGKKTKPRKKGINLIKLPPAKKKRKSHFGVGRREGPQLLQKNERKIRNKTNRLRALGQRKHRGRDSEAYIRKGGDQLESKKKKRTLSGRLRGSRIVDQVQKWSL